MNSTMENKAKEWKRLIHKTKPLPEMSQDKTLIAIEEIRNEIRELNEELGPLNKRIKSLRRRRKSYLDLKWKLQSSLIKPKIITPETVKERNRQKEIQKEKDFILGLLTSEEKEIARERGCNV